MGIYSPKYIEQTSNRFNNIPSFDFNLQQDFFSRNSNSTNTNGSRRNNATTTTNKVMKSQVYLYYYYYYHHIHQNRNNNNNNINEDFDIKMTEKKPGITYACKHCKMHLSSSNEIMSKDYRGRLGNAYLINKVINIIEGTIRTKPMATGIYKICDIECQMCQKVLGWKYLKSDSKDQKFKENKYLLELETISKYA
ncbi:Moh1p NDAI_0J00480 [Naumovozyma dairenensis CBS 421]|uniref:Yippee domain-containing protein n=1 Tax=Naumovozyma dairenensis (strain ATCC 10597 / BCRC 20456 / CBS 421 / NBRC 0211 / NRRL Y-12639) TaxID=1071378 RepID=G0WGL2_NAUDC|nr:hypothetical protein NDAI_0J00480 [Naumovozyma dairenensis CBS 421]CCD26940.1 hypothetical protein NDAI_0J00480 [Naumovozyma dairenensis CBS 421]